jgi:replication factor C small subunit
MKDDSPWIEKYRPQSLTDVIGQDKIVKRLKATVQRTKKGDRTAPNMLFAGRQGTGKTSCAIAFVKDLLGDAWRMNWRELNASDERGIKVVREHIKKFARSSVIPDKKLGKVFNIIFLDEADELTPEAQNALKRVMEEFASTCRFILSVNHSNKVIGPIQDRCAIYRFGLISPEDIRDYIVFIANREKILIDEKAAKAIGVHSKGSLRRALNILYQASLQPDMISEKDILEVVGQISPDVVKKIYIHAKKRELGKADELIIKAYYSGYDPEGLLELLFEFILDSKINDRMKIKILGRMGDVHHYINTGDNSLLQLRCFIAWISDFIYDQIKVKKGRRDKRKE